MKHKCYLRTRKKQIEIKLTLFIFIISFHSICLSMHASDINNFSYNIQWEVLNSLSFIVYSGNAKITRKTEIIPPTREKYYSASEEEEVKKEVFKKISQTLTKEKYNEVLESINTNKWKLSMNNPERLKGEAENPRSDESMETE